MRRFSVLFIIAFVIALAIFVVAQARGEDNRYGAFVALCPGPDYYGYVCDNGDTFAYIDADQDTQLYVDDGTVIVNLPFPFTFYGNTHEQVTISSNGNLQFTTANANFLNECFAGNPLVGMGQLIAPYWDDLDLTLFGFVQTKVVGEAPHRIFVIEWDEVPYYGDFESTVTFEVQLFETSHDIVFLYQTVDLGVQSNGRSATIGIQNEDQGLALVFSCNQPTVVNTRGIQFAHPDEPQVEMPAGLPITAQTKERQPKGVAFDLLRLLQTQGEAGILRYQQRLLSQNPPRSTQWQWLDLTGDTQAELIWLMRSTPQYPNLSRLIILGKVADGEIEVLLDQALSQRDMPTINPILTTPSDVTGDDIPELLIQDQQAGMLWFIRADNIDVEALLLPHNCTGRAELIDIDQDGVAELVQNNCQQGKRQIQLWQEGIFIPVP